MRKYTIYAIGEIALVVIGILIALSNQKEQEAEMMVLKEVVENLEANILSYNQRLNGTI
jgi:hypothetical protein